MLHVRGFDADSGAIFNPQWRFVDEKVYRCHGRRCLCGHEFVRVSPTRWESEKFSEEMKQDMRGSIGRSESPKEDLTNDFKAKKESVKSETKVKRDEAKAKKKQAKADMKAKKEQAKAKAKAKKEAATCKSGRTKRRS